jgi:RNA polymerase sigma factor (TIGR02999 family)
MSQPHQSVSELLDRWKAGDREALDALVPLIYTELHRIAHYYLQRERSEHTLQTTALVHEAYLRMVKQGPVPTQNREHFVAVAAKLMRQILVDYARSHRAAKRGAEFRVEMEEGFEPSQNRGTDLIALDDALNQLAQFDPQQSRIVELRFFGGLTGEETAAVLGISAAAVGRDWNMAKAWLSRELRKGSDGKSTAVGKD